MNSEINHQSYYAVIFTAARTEDDCGYEETAKRMKELAAEQPGYLGIESARSENSRIGITVSYWRDLESIKNWKQNLEHVEARKLGKEKWYANYTLRICKVEREYEWSKK